LQQTDCTFRSHPSSKQTNWYENPTSDTQNRS
jgi:hypothetical protein